MSKILHLNNEKKTQVKNCVKKVKKSWECKYIVCKIMNGKSSTVLLFHRDGQSGDGTAREQGTDSQCLQRSPRDKQIHTWSVSNAAPRPRNS